MSAFVEKALSLSRRGIVSPAKHVSYPLSNTSFDRLIEFNRVEGHLILIILYTLKVSFLSFTVTIFV